VPTGGDRGGEPNPLALAGCPAIPDLYARHLDRTDSGLNGAFRTMTVAHNTIAAVRKLEVLHRLEKGLRLQFDGLRQ
jgi:hypothetical protein